MKASSSGFCKKILETSSATNVTIPSSPKFFKRIDDLSAMKWPISCKTVFNNINLLNKKDE